MNVVANLQRLRDVRPGQYTSMLLIIALIVPALVTGVLGFLIKGAFWLLVLTALFLVGAYLAGKKSKR